MIRRHPATVFWVVSASVVLLDQATKAVIRALWSNPEAAHPFDMLAVRAIAGRFSSLESVDLIGSMLRLTFVQNAGAAFGLLPGHRSIFIATSVLVLIAIAGYWRKARPDEWPVVLGSALIAGGAVGNLIDRALFGHVTDFLDIAPIDFPIFNLADMGIVGGVGIVMAWLLFGPQDAPAQPEYSEPAQPEYSEPAQPEYGEPAQREHSESAESDIAGRA